METLWSRIGPFLSLLMLDIFHICCIWKTVWVDRELLDNCGVFANSLVCLPTRHTKQSQYCMVSYCCCMVLQSWLVWGFTFKMWLRILDVLVGQWLYSITFFFFFHLFVVFLPIASSWFEKENAHDFDMRSYPNYCCSSVWIIRVLTPVKESYLATDIWCCCTSRITLRTLCSVFANMCS